ncbi:acetyltransferase [Geomicrobium sp. JCM 19055]|nr:acetyltransferase [Geomicrobium sp. JCM 19055]
MRNGQSSLLHYMEIRERENNLGLVRFIVACLVMYFHAYYLTGNAHNYELLRVMTFFIISGFFVYGSFSRNLNAFRFIFARAIRIFPGLIGVVLFTTFIIGPWMTSLSLNDYLHSGETWQYLRTIMIYPLPPGLPGVFESNPYSHEVNGSLWTLQLEMVYYASILILFFCRWIKAYTIARAFSDCKSHSLLSNVIWNDVYRIVSLLFNRNVTVCLAPRYSNTPPIRSHFHRDFVGIQRERHVLSSIFTSRRIPRFVCRL